MDKLFTALNKKMLQLRIDADNHKCRCSWCYYPGLIMATDGYIGYILPERECYVRFSEDGHLNRTPVDIHKTEDADIVFLTDIVTRDGKLYYRTHEPDVYIDVKKADLFKDCRLYAPKGSKGLFLAYYQNLPVGIIMGRRIKEGDSI